MDETSQDESTLMAFAPIIAYCVDLVATAGTQFGFTLQKKGHTDAEEKRVRVLCSIYWWVGIALLGMTYLVHIAALPFADMVLLASNTAVSVVFTQMWAICFLKEKAVWKYDLSACLLIVVGSLTIVWSSSHEDTVYTRESIRDLITDNSALLCYLIFVLFVITSIAVQYKFKIALMHFKKDLHESRKV